MFRLIKFRNFSRLHRPQHRPGNEFKTKPKRKQCGRCRGKGNLNCVKCGGRLYVYSYSEKKYGITVDTMIKCPNCRYGKVICDNCMGTGYSF